MAIKYICAVLLYKFKSVSKKQPVLKLLCNSQV